MASCHRTTQICGMLMLVFISSFVQQTEAVLTVTTSPSFIAKYPTQSVTFTCTVTDNLYTVTSIRWYFSNTLILTNGVPVSSYTGRASGGTVSSPSFTLTNLVMSDAGSYICSASNSNGETRNSSHSTLGMQNGVTPSNVQIANVVGNTISLIAGDSIILNCSASGSPTPTITFWRNGAKIWDGSPYTLTNIQSGQAGQYMCRASNFFGDSNSTVQLDVYVKPSTVSLSVTSTNVNVNQAVTFSCSANGIPSQSYRWYRGNTLISGQTGSTYQITSAQGADSGSYQCQAYNIAGSTTSSTVTLTVNTAVAPTSATISSSPANGQVNEGGTITLTCTSDGTTPSYSWTRNGAATTWNTQSITITNAGSQDTDTYVCQASNAVGSVVRSFSVNVIISPKSVTISPSTSATYSVGNVITLTCSAAGSSPTYSWTHGSRTFQGAVVNIPSAQRSDSGTYVCQASNAAGSSTSSVTVTVFYAPQVVSILPTSLTVNSGDQIQLSCSADGLPTPTYKWFKGLTTWDVQTLTISSARGSDSGIYACQASNSQGSKNATVTVSVTAIAPTSATITSSPANGQVNGGGAITLTCTSDGTDPSYSWTRNGAATTWNTQSITITNARSQDADTYVCRASNAGGSVFRSFSVTVIIAPTSATITSSPANGQVNAGGTITLTCTSDGTAPSYSWTRNGAATTWNTQSITITNARSQDTDTYVCQAFNGAGSVFGSFTVTVIIAPTSATVSSSPANGQVNAGGTITLTCTSDGTAPSYSWTRNGAATTWNTQSITISNARSQDADTYVCRASNAGGSVFSSFSVTVTNAPTSATITSSPANGQVNAGGTITLTCTSDGTAPSYSWTRNGASTTWNTQSIIITNARSQDADTYVCQATNGAGSVFSSLSVTVISSPNSVTISPSISATYSVGNTITLTCSAAGSSPTYSWTHGSRTFQGAVVTIPSAQRSDSGTYVCQASNAAGSSTSSVIVTVFYAPQVVSISPTSLAVNSGNQIQLSCSADGLPTPTYKWFKGLTTLDVQTLTIASARGSDSGVYACQATNSEGSKNATVTVSVTAIGPGTITFSQTSPLTALKGNQVSVTCIASGTPTPTFRWSKGGTTIFNGATLSLSNVDKTDSGVYTCTGTNSEGTNTGQFTLNVQYAPQMTTTSNSISATDGDTVSLTCNNDANPEASTFEWNCQGSISNTTKTLSVGVSGTDDFSCSCKAFNSIGGSVLQTFSVTISASGSTGNIGAATGGGLTTGEIAAICLAVLFVILLIIIIIVCCCLYGVCAGVCGKKEKHKVEPQVEKEKEVIHHVEIPRFHEKPKSRVPSAVTRKDVDVSVNHDNMMYEEEEFEINTKYAIVPPGSHRSVNGTIISMHDQRAPKDHRLPAIDLTYDEEERRRKKRRKKKKHRSHREPAEGMETTHVPRESSRSRRSHRSHRSSHRYSGELMDDGNYYSRYEDGDLVVIPGPDNYDQ